MSRTVSACLSAPEIGELEDHQRLGEPPEQRGGQQCDEAQRAEHRGEDAVGGLLSPFGANAGVEGNQGNRERADPQEVVEHVRDLEGGIVGVGFGTDTEAVGEHGLAHEAEHSGEEEARRQQCGGGGHAPPSGVATSSPQSRRSHPPRPVWSIPPAQRSGDVVERSIFRSVEYSNVQQRPRPIKARVDSETPES